MIVRLLRTWLVHLVACLPLLGILLVPQLQRSRAGSEALLGVGVVILLVVVIAAVLVAPLLSAVAAPSPPRWMPVSAWRGAREAWRRRTGAALLALGGFAVGYALAQLAGLGVAAILPYIRAGENGWVIDYPAYALQALVIYLVATAGLSVYADRIRRLALAVGSTS